LAIFTLNKNHNDNQIHFVEKFYIGGSFYKLIQTDQSRQRTKKPINAPLKT